MELKIGQEASWVDEYDGRLTGRITEVWPEQEMAVLDVVGKSYDATYFVPVAKLLDAAKGGA